jgi:hypothetical protein
VLFCLSNRYRRERGFFFCFNYFTHDIVPYKKPNLNLNRPKLQQIAVNFFHAPDPIRITSKISPNQISLSLSLSPRRCSLSHTEQFYISFRRNTCLSLSSTADVLGRQPLKGRFFDLSLPYKPVWGGERLRLFDLDF